MHGLPNVDFILHQPPHICYNARNESNQMFVSSSLSSTPLILFFKLNIVSQIKPLCCNMQVDQVRKLFLTLFLSQLVCSIPLRLFPVHSSPSGSRSREICLRGMENTRRIKNSKEIAISSLLI